MAKPNLRAVPDVEAQYSELSTTEQAGILRNSIKELEQKLFVARMNAKMQARLIGAPISEARKNTAKRELRQINDVVPDFEESIACLREELAAMEDLLPTEPEKGDD